MDWQLIVLLALNFVFSTTADGTSKLWAMQPFSKWAFATIAFSILAACTWMLVIRKVGLTAGSAIMLLLTMISTVLIGLFFFKEQITRGQEIGVILGIIAAVFLLVGRRECPAALLRG